MTISDLKNKLAEIEWEDFEVKEKLSNAIFLISELIYWKYPAYHIPQLNYDILSA